MNEILVLKEADSYIQSFLRKDGKSVDEYNSTEEVIRDFLDYCSSLELGNKNGR